MKNKLEQELKQKEFENEIGKDLHLESSKMEHEERKNKGKNKYVVAAVHFFGTLFVCYFLLYIARMLIGTLAGGLGMVGVNLAWLNPLIHGAIWVLAVYSVYKKRSVLDDILFRFF